MTVKLIQYCELLSDPNIISLFAEYEAECSLPELGTACPQTELYESMEKSGALQIFAAYDGDTLVGFASVIVYVLPHYGKKVAATESIFATKGSNGVGRELMSYIELYAKYLGCEAFLYTAPKGSRFDKLLSVDARHTNNSYLKELA